jgi:hypothetical protein
MRRPWSSNLELEHRSQSQSMCTHKTALAVADGGSTTPVVGKLDPRVYRWPLIGDGGVEEVEVEGSMVAQCSMVQTEHKGSKVVD